MFCRIFQSIMSLVIGMISARYLGPSNYGLISYAASITAFVVPIVQLGLRNILVQELVSEPEKDGEILGTALGMSVCSSFLGIVGVLAFVSIANRGERDTFIVCGLYSLSLVFQMTEMIQYWYQAKLMSKYTSITALLVYVVVSAYRIYLLVTAKSIYWFAVVNALDYLLVSIVLLVIYWKLNGGRLKVSRNLAKKLFSKSKYYIVSGMMITIFSQTDRIMLKLLCNDATVGYYSAAATCAGITSFIFVAIIDSFRPVIFENKKRSQELFEKNMSSLYALILYMGLAQSLLFTIFAKYIISMLYGIEYINAVSILQVIVWYSSFSYMGSARNIWILAEEKQQHLWLINLSGVILNIMGNLILIPSLGADGAAIATVITQFFTNFVLSFIFRPINRNGKLLIDAMRPSVMLDMVRRITKK